jgi:hypothetical protein
MQNDDVKTLGDEDEDVETIIDVKGCRNYGSWKVYCRNVQKLAFIHPPQSQNNWKPCFNYIIVCRSG